MYTNFISMTGTQYAENNLRKNLNRLNQYNKVEGALATFSTLNNFVLRFRFKILGFVGMLDDQIYFNTEQSKDISGCTCKWCSATTANPLIVPEL